MKKFVSKLESKYGKVEYNEDGGFGLNVEAIVDDKKMVAFVGGGNHGQEIVTGYYLKNLEMLDSVNCQKVIKEVNDGFYNMVVESKLERY